MFNKYLHIFILLFLLLSISFSAYASGPAIDNAANREPALSMNVRPAFELQAIDYISSPVVTNTTDTQCLKTETPGSEEKAEPAIINHYDSPVAVKAVDRNMSLFSEKIKERFSLYLSRSGRYLDMMKEILKSRDMPEDIAFLPLIESGFNPNAYSKARAVGPWQFISATAKRYGLKIDWWLDERKDPVKSTEAAASYLKDLYEMFGSWNLALAAYNAGEGKIMRALNRTKSDDYWALLNTKHIRSETKEYVPRFIAARMIANSPDNYGFENIAYHPPFEYDEVVLNSPVDLEVAATCAMTTYETIKELNPELRRWSTPPHGQYRLRIPSGKKEIFIANLANIPEEDRFSIVAYTVKKGDTVNSIANKAGVPLNVLLELNGNIRTLKAGEKIYFPPKDKFYLDRDDKAKPKKASLKPKGVKKKSINAKRQKKERMVVASADKQNKGAYND